MAGVMVEKLRSFDLNIRIALDQGQDVSADHPDREAGQGITVVNVLELPQSLIEVELFGASKI